MCIIIYGGMGKKALVVEYEPRYVQRLTSTLQEQDYEVSIAKDGEEALKKAKEWRPDVIFLSAVLPKLRSSEVIQGIRGVPELASVRIVLLATGVKEDAIDTEKKKKGVDGILCKPFSETRVIDVLSLMKGAAAPPPAPSPAPKSNSLLDALPKQEKKMTSEDLFGDFIEDAPKATPAPLPDPAKAATPAPPPPQAPPAAPKPSTSKDDKGGDVDALLHKTLSGMGAPKPRKTEATAPKLGGEMDRKLTETLSGLDLSSRPRRTETTPAAPQPPQPSRESRPAGAKPQPVTVETHPPAEELKPAPPKPEPPKPPAPKPAPPPPPPAPKEEGERFGNYLLVEKLGTGGMAEIWKAKMQGVEGFQKLVAIKRILPQFSHNQDFTTMFIDEAKLAAQLSHRNIVHIYDLGKLEDSYFIAMEYVEGTDLRRVNMALRERGDRMPVPLALFILSQMASALDYAHKRRDGDGRDLNIVHRDVSPQNILLAKDGEVKICDFGIAKAASKASHTRAGSLKGKLQYMSPEQAWGKTVDYRSDIFSLGVVLYEMLAGKHLFEGDSELSILEKVRHPKVEAPSQFLPGLPKVIDDIVMKALQEEPDDRYTDAGHLFRELDDVIQHYAPRAAEKTVAQFLTALSQKGAALPSFAYTAPPAPKPAEEPKPAPPPMPVQTKEEPKAEEPPKVAEKPKTAEPQAPPVERPPDEERRKGKKGKNRDRQAERAREEDKPKVKFEEKKPEPPAAKLPEPPIAEKRVPSFLDTGKSGEDEEKKKSPVVFIIAGAAALVLIILGVVFMGGGKKEAAPPPAQPPQEQPVQVPVEPALPDQTPQQPKPQTPKPEPAPVVETPKPAPVAEQPKPQTPAPTPPTETPKPAPVVEQPKPQEPVPAPVVEPPKPAPVVEEPKPAPAPIPIEPPKAKYKAGDLVALGTPGLNPPAVVKKAAPSYPPIAKMQKVQGDVTVQVLVDDSGRVTSTKVLTGPSLLGNAAQDAAKNYQFIPASIDGVKVKCYYNIVFNFRL